MDLHIDLGQLIISTLIAIVAIVGWFVKKEIKSFGDRLDKHEQVLFDMNAVLSRAVGEVAILLKLFQKERI
jgi:hypothetical protein